MSKWLAAFLDDDDAPAPIDSIAENAKSDKTASPSRVEPISGNFGNSGTHPADTKQGATDQRAYAAALVDWQCQHPPSTDPTRCAACGDPIAYVGTDWRPLADGAVVHYAGSHGLRCWQRWGDMRRQDAVAALADMGIVPPATNQGETS